MFELIRKMFIGLLTSIVNVCNHAKCVSFCMTQLTFISLDPNECTQEFLYYPFVVKLDRCIGSCNTLIDLFSKVCIPNKTEDLNLSVFNIITEMNESKTLTNYISCECKCRFDGEKNVIQINGGITINVDVSVKKVIYVKKFMFGVFLQVIVKMENI